MNHFTIQYDQELGIEIPHLHVPFDQLDQREREELYVKMEEISGKIPERIRQLEHEYKEMYDRVSRENSDQTFFDGMERLNQISRLISELNILYLQMQGRYLTSYQGG
ncbi:MAG: hypothetical protein IMW85_10285 [Thermicanus sp.]|nr:hypothetical protein [Thermicanus sp.]